MFSEESIKEKTHMRQLLCGLEVEINKAKKNSKKQNNLAFGGRRYNFSENRYQCPQPHLKAFRLTFQVTDILRL